MLIFKYILIPFLLIFPAGFLKGQSPLLLAEVLKKNGFENIRVTEKADRVTLSVENSAYRWEVTAIRKVLDLVSGQADLPVTMEVILLEKGIPALTVSVKSDDWKRFREGSLPAEQLAASLEVSELPGEAWEAVREMKPSNRSAGKTDLILFPQFYFENTLKTRLYTSQLNIAPALQIMLRRGMQFTGQVIVPLHNELGYEGESIRPGLVVLSQEFRYQRLTGKAAAGNFSSNRYGADLSLRYLLPYPGWSLKANAGLTGSSHFLDKELLLGSLTAVTGSLSATWFIPRYTLELEGGVQRYIYGDNGLFGSLTRWFGETAIGFYAQVNRGEGKNNINGGFHFTVPFPVKKRPRNHFFRVTIPEYQGFVYNGATEFYYGQRYSSEPGSNMVKGFMRAGYVKREMLKVKSEK